MHRLYIQFKNQRVPAARTACLCMLFLTACLQRAANAQTPAPSRTDWINDTQLYVYTADNSTNSPLQNPVLFVEGFDLYNDMNWEELYTLFNQANLIEELRQQGRDVLIMNYADATRKVWNNSLKTRAVINYINSIRSSLGPDNKFTVIGVSMGGLTTRLALDYMEEEGDPHYVDTWISFDAPHEGANAPLSLQFYADFFLPFQYLSTDFLPMVELWNALNSLAAQELLLVHSSESYNAAAGARPSAFRSRLISLLDEKGYPADCKKISISNGSGFGEKHPISPGEKIIHWENPLLPWIDTDIYTLPLTTGDPDIDANQTAFEGLFYIYEGGETVQNSHFALSLDNAPGGTSDMFGQLYAMLNYIDDNDFCTYSNHCFVPTVSALGIPIEQLDANLSEYPDLLALTPFDEIHYAVENEPHIEINIRNKRWFMRAILEDIDSDEDGLDDYQEYAIGTDYTEADSDLQVETRLDSAPAAEITKRMSTDGSSMNSVTVSYNALQNIQYSIWFTESLEQPWTLLDTIPASSNSLMVNTYVITNASGYFQTTGEWIDPVTD